MYALHLPYLKPIEYGDMSVEEIQKFFPATVTNNGGKSNIYSCFLIAIDTFLCILIVAVIDTKSMRGALYARTLPQRSYLPSSPGRYISYLAGMDQGFQVYEPPTHPVPPVRGNCTFAQASAYIRNVKLRPDAIIEEVNFNTHPIDVFSSY